VSQQTAKFSLEEFRVDALRILKRSGHKKPAQAATIEAVKNASSLAALMKAINIAIIQCGMSASNRADLEIIKGFMKLQYPDEYPGIAR